MDKNDMLHKLGSALAIAAVGAIEALPEGPLKMLLRLVVGVNATAVAISVGKTVKSVSEKL